jgi:hypothetical protein
MSDNNQNTVDHATTNDETAATDDSRGPALDARRGEEAAALGGFIDSDGDDSRPQSGVAAAAPLSDFKKVVVELTRDLLITFPELANDLHPWLRTITSGTANAETEAAALKGVYDHCKRILPDKFFDILYQHDKLFASDKSTEFLPGICFGRLWQENLSDQTRTTLWKYMQLLLFTVVGGLEDGTSFGAESAKMFESLNQADFKAKLEDTVNQMQELFGGGGGAKDDDVTGEEAPPGINLSDLPNPSDLHDHVNNMMKGKLGSLAREIAEETAADLNMGSASSVQDVFKNLMQNPTKLMGIVKSVGTKLDEKMKSGDMKESDLLKEANDLMEQMKGMPGMSSMQSMFAKMGMDLGSMGMGGAGGGGGGKVNVNAMQANIQRSMGVAKQRERMKERLMERQAQQQQQVLAQQQQVLAQQAQALEQQASPLALPSNAKQQVFSKGEHVERSSPLDKPSTSSSVATEATTATTAAAATTGGMTTKKKKKKSKSASGSTDAQ